MYYGHRKKVYTIAHAKKKKTQLKLDPVVCRD